MQEAYERTADAIECALSNGFDVAMNRYNVSDKPPKEVVKQVSETSDEKKADTP
jgi:hypothetical protein